MKSFFTSSKMNFFDDKRLDGAASNGIREACDEENESLMDAIGSKDVEHRGGQATSKSNNERSIRTYYSKSRIVGVLVAIAIVFYLFGIKSEAQLHTTSTEADEVALTKEEMSLASAPAVELLEGLRSDLAAISIDMMKSDMATDAKNSKFIDIGPLCDMIESALEEVGMWGVFRWVLADDPFVVSLTAAAQAKDVHGFSVHVRDAAAHYDLQYNGVPNDRDYKDKNMCSGCKWWLNHYVGAISADVLMRKGSLKLDSKGEDRISDAAAFMHELQKMQRLEDAEISTHHVGHGFTWQYLAVTMNRIKAYPLIMAHEFCGDLLWKDEYHSRLNNDIGRECRHGFGHAVFYVLAMRETGGLKAHSVRKQVRPDSGFQLSDESMCQGYRICEDAPNVKTLDECIGALKHSDKILNGLRDKKGFDHKNKCSDIH
jgi:hypothetical protein